LIGDRTCNDCSVSWTVVARCLFIRDVSFASLDYVPTRHDQSATVSVAVSVQSLGGAHLLNDYVPAVTRTISLLTWYCNTTDGRSTGITPRSADHARPSRRSGPILNGGCGRTYSTATVFVDRRAGRHGFLTRGRLQTHSNGALSVVP